MADPELPSAAQERVSWLLTVIQRIQHDLGDREVLDVHGERMDDQTYWQWRRRAKRALEEQTQLYRVAKVRLQEERRTQRALRLQQAQGEEEANGMRLQKALALKAAFDGLFEGLEVQLVPRGLDRCALRLVVEGYPAITIFAGTVDPEQKGAEA